MIKAHVESMAAVGSVALYCGKCGIRNYFFYRTKNTNAPLLFFPLFFVPFLPPLLFRLIPWKRERINVKPIARMSVVFLSLSPFYAQSPKGNEEDERMRMKKKDSKKLMKY